MRKLYAIVFLQFLITFSCFCDETKDSTDKSILKEFLLKVQYPLDVVNQPTVEVSYGFAYPSFRFGYFKNTLAKAYPIELKYGFSRIDTQKVVAGLLSYASEFTFIRDISSDLKPYSWVKKGITTDNWSFGFGFSNGSGYNTENARLILYNSGKLTWSRVDFELDADNPKDQNTINIYDIEYRFGTSFDMGMKLQLYSSINLDASYEHTLVFPRHLFWKWLESSSIELILQRTVDYYENELMNFEEFNYPVINFLIKNAISFTFYEFRRQAMNWPFKSEPPLNYDSFRVGFSFLF